jgi:hypothetical protein
VLLLNTRVWLHETRIPPQCGDGGFTLSLARDITRWAEGAQGALVAAAPLLRSDLVVSASNTYNSVLCTVELCAWCGTPTGRQRQSGSIGITQPKIAYHHPQACGCLCCSLRRAQGDPCLSMPAWARISRNDLRLLRLVAVGAFAACSNTCTRSAHRVELCSQSAGVSIKVKAPRRSATSETICLRDDKHGRKHELCFRYHKDGI